MASCNYWVFREGRSTVAGPLLREGLAQALKRLRSGDRDALNDALLRAGELETALADAQSEDVAPAAVITNAVAAALVGLWSGDAGLDSLAGAAARLRVPDSLDIATPEGFAYYALHPLAYSELADKIEIPSAHAAVIGIRSIGSTLSAVVAATLARRKILAQRITVRPSGSPYDRKTEFSPDQLRWNAAFRSKDAEFLVVDEGPGLSGSSFLSVGDALLEAGVERRRIHFLCSREPDPESLVAPDAANRWRTYSTQKVGDDIPLVPPAAKVNACGGEWRKLRWSNEENWPASWTQMERAKFFSGDHTRLFKFIGHGRFGALVADRARLLSESGFGPKLCETSGGFTAYEMVKGRPATPADLSRAAIERIADYCAWRAVEFRVDRRPSQLAQAIRFNFEQLTGGGAPTTFSFEESQETVVCDARMLPHEWVLGNDDTLVKTDGESHGDDHFFPGPCDIAWDLAGAAVEWNMDANATDSLLRRFHLRSGDNARPRFPSYVLGYAVFRAAYCTMAAFALRGTPEEERLTREVARYKRVIDSFPHHPHTSTSYAPFFNTVIEFA